jgi:hypothetical protein
VHKAGKTNTQNSTQLLGVRFPLREKMNQLIISDLLIVSAGGCNKIHAALDSQNIWLSGEKVKGKPIINN